MADQTTPTRIVGLEQPRHDDQRQERTRYETGGEGDDAPVASFETETVMLGGAPSYGSAGARPAPTTPSSIRSARRTATPPRPRRLARAGC